MNVKRSLFFVRDNFYHPGTLFPAANVLNFSQAHNPVGTAIALGNLAFSVATNLATAGLKSLSETSRVRNFFAEASHYIENDPELQKNKLLRDHMQDFLTKPLSSAFKFVGRQLTSPLRVTAYSALAVGAVLLSSGAAAALLPGLAAVSFGIGNTLASSPTIERLNENPEAKAIYKAITHPAVYYGLGYTAAGLMAGGGLGLFFHPLHNIPASLSTVLGVSETTLALVGMGMGKFKNPAAGFMAVAIGTFVNSVSGLLSGNIPSAMANGIAGLGESWLATDSQKKFNLAEQKDPDQLISDKPSKLSAISDILTMPVRKLMNVGLVASLPSPSS